MGDPLFITQPKLEEWIEEGEVLFEDNTLTIFAENTSYDLEPAIRILTVLDGVDTQALLGRIISISEVASLRAEHLRDSVIVGDTAYQCEEGFVALGRATESAPVPVAAEAAPPAAEDKSSDMDLLADFLLKHL